MRQLIKDLIQIRLNFGWIKTKFVCEVLNFLFLRNAWWYSTLKVRVVSDNDVMLWRHLLASSASKPFPDVFAPRRGAFLVGHTDDLDICPVISVKQNPSVHQKHAMYDKYTGID